MDRYVAPSREGKAAVTIYVDPETRGYLRQYALDTDQSVQAILDGLLSNWMARVERRKSSIEKAA